jgi:hypothetical protein
MNRLCLAVLTLSTLTALALPAAPPEEPRGPRPINLAVNTKADEDDPHIASDGLTLYYASNAKGKFDIMVAQRAKRDQPWPAGALLESWIGSEVDDRSVFVTAEGRFPQYLYYATRKDKDGTNFDLYVATKLDAKKVFANAAPVRGIDTEADELHPWLTADGKRLYFTRRTKDGLCVFVASRAMADGPQGFGEAAPVKDIPPDFHHATLTPDGRTMYLQGPLDKGRWGLFTAAKTNTGWGKPEPLDQLNHPDAPTGDRSPCLSRDGTLLYFASDRPDGKGGLDLWAVPVAQLAKKK